MVTVESLKSTFLFVVVLGFVSWDVSIVLLNLIGFFKTLFKRICRKNLLKLKFFSIFQEVGYSENTREHKK